MLQDRLNDAAIALSQVLSDARIKFGIFGGYAIAVLGGQRPADSGPSNLISKTNQIGRIS